MKKILWLFVLFLLSAAGCGASDIPQTAAPGADDIPVYSRHVSRIKLQEDYNPYMMEFSESGVFYCVQKAELQDESGEYINGYDFFYQPYDGGEVTEPVCELKEGYVRDITSIGKDGSEHLALLWIDDAAHILEYDENGELCKDVLLAQAFNSLEDFPILLALPTGEYVVHMGGEAFLLESDGSVKASVRVEGYVSRLLCTEDGLCYVIHEKDEDGKTSVVISEIDFARGNTVKTRNVPGGYGNVSVFEGNTFASCSDEYIYLFDMDEAKDEVLADLKKQNIFLSQIQNISGTREEIRVATLDSTDPDAGVCLISLAKKAEGSDDESAETEGQELYSEDGRRIVRVAVPEGYVYQIEYRAGKYNQTSELCYVEIDRFEGTLQDYLGRGARPDVVMLDDHTEIAEFMEREYLADMLPLFEGQDTYSVSNIIPKARELLGDGEGMYAMTGTFRLLLRASDGTEFDAEGKCSAVDYLRWYDAFLEENEITGMGSLEDILYADISSFYDEETGEAFFASEEFKELMTTYKEVTDRHRGELQQHLARDKGWTVRRIAEGPWWCMGVGQEPMILTEPNGRLIGMPSSAGSSTVLMALPYPMGIMDVSECKEGAFDFIMYYSRAGLINKGSNPAEADTIAAELYQTRGIFSTYEDILKEEIYETEKPFAVGAVDDNGEFTSYYFTEEHKEQLTNLIESAAADTKAQKDIYGFFSEEMDGYLNGDRTLDDVCEILQNRVSLYLSEQQ